MSSLVNAIMGRSGINGGLNLKEFKAALTAKYPHNAALILNSSRKDLESHYRAEAGKEKQTAVDSQSAPFSPDNGLVHGDNFTFVYAGKKYSRWVPADPALIEIKCGPIAVPKDFVPGTAEIADYPGALEMATIEKKLRAIKSLIDDYEGDNQYKNITDIAEYYKNLKRILKEKYRINYATNAFLKLFEMLHYLHLVPDNDKEFRVFHNCELPGAMIQSTIYYMKNFRPKRKYEWWGSSLAPDSTNKVNALDDQYGLWRSNRQRWIMSLNDPNNNGDTTKVSNIHQMEHALKGKVDLYTSDAGIGVGFGMSDTGLAYNDQEQLNMLINLGQILAMLETLKEGGNFITKQYTFFKPFTYSLMLIVASMFDKFYITKPLTSKPSNSETYLAGIGFKGLTPEWKKYLEDALSSYKGVVPMPGPLLPAAVMTEHRAALDKMIAAASDIYAVQGELVKSNIELFKAFKDAPRELEACVINQREKLEKDWIERYHIR